MKEKSICLVKGCDRVTHGKGLCHKHYQQLRKHGEISLITRYDANQIIIDGDIAYVVLRDIKAKETGRTIIDIDDIEKLKPYKWRLLKKPGYAVTGNGSSTLLMHRLINDTPRDMITDHINFDRLDNRKANLRSCTLSQNVYHRKPSSVNTSGFKGVWFNEGSGKWEAAITSEGKKKHLGLFKTKKEAAGAYDKAATELHREFAYLNRPD